MPISDLSEEEKRAIKGALRRAYRQSPRMRDVLNAARVELPPAIKKDGTPGKKNQVRYKCAICGKLTPSKWVNVDHKNPVVPLDRKESDMTPNELVDGIFCDQSNLQVLCSTPIKELPKGEKSCHTIKSTRENYIRKNINENGGSIAEWEAKYELYLKQKEEEKRLKEERKKNKQLKKPKTAS